MDIDILSLFPEYFRGPFDVSILKRAEERKLININAIDIRDFAIGKHRKVDDRPYGGGPGMVLMAQPIIDAIRSRRRCKSHVIYLSPQGKPFTAKRSEELAREQHLIILCGHYEGIDERVIDLEVDEELSIGDYVLTSGCPAATVLVDAITRFIPGAIGHEDAVYQDSFSDGVFDSPHYTRPPEFEHRKVPEILLGGDHAKIDSWRKAKGQEKTRRIRPDLIRKELYNEPHSSY